jgi:hypothetical protein
MLKSLVEKFNTFSSDLAPHGSFARSTPSWETLSEQLVLVEEITI